MVVDKQSTLSIDTGTRAVCMSIGFYTQDAYLFHNSSDREYGPVVVPVLVLKRFL